MKSVSLSPRQTRLLRLKAQRLNHTAFVGDSSGEEPPTLSAAPGAGSSPPQVVQSTFAIQAQDLPAALLSVCLRGAGFTTQDVEKARNQERSIAWTWLMRGTLHLASAEDIGWLLPLLGPIFIAGGRRRFQQLGWDDARAGQGLRLLLKALERREHTRPEIVRLLKDNGLPSEGQAPVHLLFRAALEGILCGGPDREKTHTYVLLEDWLGKPEPLPRPEALARLARRYLEAYAPAAPQDLSSWSGLKLGAAREAWQLIEDLVVPVEAAGKSAWLLKDQLAWLDEPLPAEPHVRLLPRFDTYLLGYAGRDLAVEPVHAKKVNAGGGMISPVVLVDGQALGTWSTQRKKDCLTVTFQPFDSLDPALIPAIQSEVAAIGRFLGLDAVLAE